ncbi:toprim domain-containing protein [Paraburkholderia adhaesiva]|uniref:toprim domain-containing protein n=1 Tax=Paraburkholderia adhaesiva TaxID=2883244 RepID=UPI001F37B326|nr:toprim domain-containing protein [Paraburkholderia adhaesiva]
MLNPTLHADIVKRLLIDFQFQSKAEGAWLQQGVCPQCGKKELFTRVETPWVVRCGRANKCGWEVHVKELYPDLFESWSDRYPQAETQPNAAADAYMQHARGFDIAAVRGWYTQEYYHDSKKNIGSATVRFGLPGTYWERLIDRPERFGKQKARFKPGGSYGGMWWKPPTLNLYTAEEIWFVEGIFDAIALYLHGVPAVALLSCNNYPEQALVDLLKGGEGRRRRLVWALDGDRAGRGYTMKWVRRSREAGWESVAAQIPQPPKGKLDWNDLHQRDRLEADDLDTYRYHGSLLIADTPLEKALLIYRRHNAREFAFDHGRRLYWFKLDMDRYDKARDIADEQPGLDADGKRDYALNEAGAVVPICNCMPTALYFQANALTDESWYYFRVEFPHGGAAVKNTFTGAQIASAAEFKKRLLAIAPGAFYTGSSAQLDRLLERQMREIKSVQTVDFVGYSREHRCYVFNDVAIKDGQIHELNDEDFFEVGKLSVKTLNQSVALSINRDLQAFHDNWVELIWQCFGPKGFVALAFWFGSLFAEQIRAEHKSFPFLEVVGEPGAGKSTLIEFLWKLFGRRDYEGFDPSKSSLAARARNFAQVSGMPVVLIEADRSEDTAKARSFDWDELKTAYNGRSVRAIGVKNGGNETREPPFRGAIVISQNATVSASEAVLQRIVHLDFDRSGQTPATKRLAEELERTRPEDVSGFLLRAVAREATIMETFEARAPEYETHLQEHSEIRSMRIAKNHAQLMALVDALALVVPLSAERLQAVHQTIVELAIARQRAISADHPLVQEFWEIFDYLNGDPDEPRLNHSIDQSLIAVNLTHFVQEAGDRRQQVPPLVELKKHLRLSKGRKYVDAKVVRSGLRTRDPGNRRIPEVLHCWIFQRP